MKTERSMSLYICTGHDAEGRAIYKPLVISFSPCPNSNNLEGVYRSEPIEKVQKQLSSRMERFLRANAIGSMLDKQQYFRGDHFIDNGYAPMTGAFGEKL